MSRGDLMEVRTRRSASLPAPHGRDARATMMLLWYQDIGNAESNHPRVRSRFLRGPRCRLGSRW